MYAIIKTGGKQYRVTEGYRLKVEKLTGAPGENIAFDQVLMVGEGASIQLGQPYLNGAKVTASIVGHGRGKKVKILTSV